MKPSLKFSSDMFLLSGALIFGMAASVQPAMALQPTPSACRAPSTLSTSQSHCSAAEDDTEITNEPGEVVFCLPLSDDTISFWQNLQPVDGINDPDAFYRVIADMEKHYCFGADLYLYEKPQVIPPYKLSTRQRKKGGTWYSAPSYQLMLSEEGLNFYLGKVAPALHRFFAPMAEASRSAEFTYETVVSAKNGSVSMKLKSDHPRSVLGDKNYYVILVQEPLQKEALLKPRHGKLFNVKVTAYYLPKGINFKNRSLLPKIGPNLHIFNDGERDNTYSDRVTWAPDFGDDARGVWTFHYLPSNDLKISTYIKGKEFMLENPHRPTMKFIWLEK